MPSGHRAQERTLRHQLRGADVFADQTVQPGFDTAFADGFAEEEDLLCLRGIQSDVEGSAQIFSAFADQSSSVAALNK